MIVSASREEVTARVRRRRLLGEDALRRKLVLDLLKRGQHRLPVIRDRRVEQRALLLDLGVVGAGVEDRLGQGRADRPYAARGR